VPEPINPPGDVVFHLFFHAVPCPVWIITIPIHGRTKNLLLQPISADFCLPTCAVSGDFQFSDGEAVQGKEQVLLPVLWGIFDPGKQAFFSFSPLPSFSTLKMNFS